MHIYALLYIFCIILFIALYIIIIYAYIYVHIVHLYLYVNIKKLHISYAFNLLCFYFLKIHIFALYCEVHRTKHFFNFF